MAFKENIAEFMSTDDFAVEVIYTPDGGSAVALTGIFDNEHYDVPGGEVTVTGSQPRFTYEAEDIAAAAGDTLEHEGVTYTVVDVQPDGTGVNVLILEAE